MVWKIEDSDSWGSIVSYNRYKKISAKQKKCPILDSS